MHRTGFLAVDVTLMVSQAGSSGCWTDGVIALDVTLIASHGRVSDCWISLALGLEVVLVFAGPLLSRACEGRGYLLVFAVGSGW